MLSILTLLLALPAYSAEYQGQNLDGRSFRGTAYSYETGGVFDVQIVFKKRWATVRFVNGSQQRLRLRRSRITDLNEIVGWNVNPVNIAGILNIGFAQPSTHNTELPRPRPFEGLWRLSVQTSHIKS
jgi:hypothetical protein